MGQPQEWEDDYPTFAEGCGGSFLRAIGNCDTCLGSDGITYGMGSTLEGSFSHEVVQCD